MNQIKLGIIEQRKHKFEIEPKISIIIPLYNTPENFFDELVENMKKQTYTNWELCLADGTPDGPIKFMQKYLKDERIKYKYIGENKGISGNTNEALSLVTGDYIGLLDHDDLLPIFSLFEVVKAINENPDAEFLYSDEDKFETIKGPRYGVFFKPDASPYTLNSANYICHFSIFKKELMDKLGGFRSDYDGSQDFDIVSRAFEQTDKIVHIPKVLYHWRAHRNSTAQNSDSKPYAFEVGKKVIKDHVKRSLNTNVQVDDGLTPGSYELKYEVNNKSKVSIIIDSPNNKADQIQEMLKEITYTNIEIIVVEDGSFDGINEAIKKSTGEYFIIVDENLKSIDKKDFIEQLLGICQDENVGIVGSKLYNENNQVEHSGIILGMNGTGDFLYKGAPKDAGTYMQRLLIIHNLMCVYGKYALINRKYFEQVKGFDTEYKGRLVSIDYSLKMQELKKQVVINPIVTFCVSKLSDEEQDVSQIENFKKKWDKYYKIGDRYFSPNLSKKNTGLSIKIDE